MASKKIMCPFCFNEFKDSEAEFQCTNTETNSNNEPFCPKEVDKKYNDYWKTETEIKHVFKNKSMKVSLFGATPTSAKCDKCGSESNRFVCPHCHNIIPSEMIELGSSEIISIIGDPDCGKTVYFTALMEEMKKRGSSWCHLTVSPVTDALQEDGESTAQLHKKFSKKLFKEHAKLDKTIYKENEHCVPLIFCLSTKNGYNDKNGKTIYLVFYDTAGEAFGGKENINKIKYLGKSSGVIMLLDPYSVPELNKTLGLPDNDKDVDSIVDQLIGSGSEALRDKPIAMVFSKFDAVINGLKDVGASYEIKGVDLKENSSFIDDKVFSPDEINHIDQAITKICEKEWGIGDLKNKICQKYSSKKKDGTLNDNVKYFAVSSLGCDINDKRPFKPYRVMDPLIWILYRIGGFDIPVK